ATLSGADGISSRAMGRQSCRHAAALRLHPIRRRTAHLHRQSLRDDGSGVAPRHRSAALPPGMAARPPGRADADHHAAAQGWNLGEDSSAELASGVSRAQRGAHAHTSISGRNGLWLSRVESQTIESGRTTMAARRSNIRKHRDKVDDLQRDDGGAKHEPRKSKKDLDKELDKALSDSFPSSDP